MATSGGNRVPRRPLLVSSCSGYRGTGGLSHASLDDDGVSSLADNMPPASLLASQRRQQQVGKRRRDLGGAAGERGGRPAVTLRQRTQRQAHADGETGTHVGRRRRRRKRGKQEEQ